MDLKRIYNIKAGGLTLNKIKWTSLGLLLFCLFITSLFPDIVITYTHSLNFLDCVFSGNFFGFYEYTLERLFYGFPADYYLLIYIIFGIWNLPIWILNKLFCIDPYSIGALLWVRTLVAVFILGIFWIIHKIFEELKEKEDGHVYFMMGSSALFVLPNFAMGQYDAISLFFILLGVFYSLKEEKISWKALCSFAIAVPIKTLAIFPVVLIILHKEKRILAIIKNIILSMMGLLLCVLPFVNNAAYNEAMTYNGGWMQKISKAVIPSGWDQGISMFWLSFFGLCIIAYKMREHSKKEYADQITWILTAFYVLFFGFTPAHPQWCVLIVPFMMLLIRNKDQNYALNIVLETAMGVSLMLLQAFHYSWVYFTDTTQWLVLKNIEAISDLKGIGSLREVFDKMLPPEVATILHAAFFATAVAIIIINHPWKKEKILEVATKENSQLEILKLDWLRLLIIFGYIFATFFIVYVI